MSWDGRNFDRGPLLCEMSICEKTQAFYRPLPHKQGGSLQRNILPPSPKARAVAYCELNNKGGVCCIHRLYL